MFVFQLLTTHLRFAIPVENISVRFTDSFPGSCSLRCVLCSRRWCKNQVHNWCKHFTPRFIRFFLVKDGLPSLQLWSSIYTWQRQVVLDYSLLLVGSRNRAGRMLSIKLWRDKLVYPLFVQCLLLPYWDYAWLKFGLNISYDCVTSEKDSKLFGKEMLTLNLFNFLLDAGCLVCWDGRNFGGYWWK